MKMMKENPKFSSWQRISQTLVLLLAFAFCLEPVFAGKIKAVFAEPVAFFPNSTTQLPPEYQDKTRFEVFEDAGGTGFYILEKKTVNTREELLAQLAANSENDLTPKQQALLTAFDESQKKDGRARQTVESLNEDAPLVLINTSSMKADEYPPGNNPVADFWAVATKPKDGGMGTVYISDLYVEKKAEGMVDKSKTPEEQARQFEGAIKIVSASTQAHEFTHIADKGKVETIEGYHWGTRVTAPKYAAAEAIAIYGGMMADRDYGDFQEMNQIRGALKIGIDYQSTSNNGEVIKKSIPPLHLNGQKDWERVEGAHALILVDLSERIGEEKVRKAIQDSNSEDRSIFDIYRQLARNNPENADVLAETIDKTTFNGLSKDELRQLLPEKNDKLEQYLVGREDTQGRIGIENSEGQAELFRGEELPTGYHIAENEKGEKFLEKIEAVEKPSPDGLTEKTEEKGGTGRENGENLEADQVGGVTMADLESAETASSETKSAPNNQKEGLAPDQEMPTNHDEASPNQSHSTMAHEPHETSYEPPESNDEESSIYEPTPTIEEPSANQSPSAMAHEPHETSYEPPPNNDEESSIYEPTPTIEEPPANEAPSTPTEETPYFEPDP